MIHERIRLDGRTVIVAGAGGGGIGAHTARAVTEAGGTVVAVDRDAAALEATCAELAEAGDAVTSLVADLRTPEGRAATLAAVPAGAAPTGLVNVVGGAFPEHWAPLVDQTEAQWHDLFDLNLHYAVFLAQRVAREMIAAGTGGSIVNLASLSCLGASPFHAGYGAAKAALQSVTRTMACEWGGHDIRVNIVAPGTIVTPRTRPGDVEDARRDRQAIPLARRGRPDEIAAVILFLLSDLSSYVSGQTLAVDGAASVKLAHLDADNIPIFVTNPAIRERLTAPGRG